MNCRFCNHALGNPEVSLGHSPIANAYLNAEALMKMEPMYPLELFVCNQCHLVQLPEFESPQAIFSDYAYFSSFSESWLTHCRQYVDAVSTRLQLNSSSQVVELASNDGYLLQYFKEKNIPVLGIEPAANVARAALEKGIPTEIAFFGKTCAERLAREGVRADLMIANNVLAHVPGLNDFVSGISTLLKPDGVITIEFPHLLNMIHETQFDTIYHEHFSYLSITTVRQVFQAHGLKLFDVEEIPTHGGSLRIYGCLSSSQKHPLQPSVEALSAREKKEGLFEKGTYQAFNQRMQKMKYNFIKFLISAKEAGHQVAAYGAPAKGNTFLNYCGIKPDLIEYTVDLNPRKQGRYLPGSHIPILAPEQIKKTKPHYVVILPWNLKTEIEKQLSFVSDWGGKFVTPNDL